MKSKVFIFPEFFVAFNLSKHSLFLGELAFIAFGDDSFFHLCRVLCVILTTAVFLNSMVFFVLLLLLLLFSSTEFLCVSADIFLASIASVYWRFSGLDPQPYLSFFHGCQQRNLGSPLSPFSRGRKGNHFSYTPI